MNSMKKYVFLVILAFVLMAQVRPGSAQTGTCGIDVSYTVTGTDTEKTITFTAAGSNAEWASDCTEKIRSNQPKTVEVLVNADGEKIALSVGTALFSNFDFVGAMNLSGLDTSKTADMYDMFSNCSALTTLDLSGWDTSQVTDMSMMFYDCIALDTLDLSGWDTSQVTNMSMMFYDCIALDTLDLSGWDTPQVTNMNAMFTYCESLTRLDLSSWDTAKVTTMLNMFYDCEALTTLDLSGWDTQKLTHYDEMFYGCDALADLTLGENTLKKEIFGSLPSDVYSAAWTYVNGYYGNDSVPLGLSKAGDALFKPTVPANSGGKMVQNVRKSHLRQKCKTGVQPDGYWLHAEFSKTGPKCRCSIRYGLQILHYGSPSRRGRI